MTPQDKIKEYHHILTMLDIGGNNDEINARVAINNQHWHNNKYVKTYLAEDYQDEPSGTMYAEDEMHRITNVKQYATSVDACKSIEEKGWIYTRTCDDDFNYYTAYSKILDNDVAQVVSTISDENLARLYAIILTKIWILEND